MFVFAEQNEKSQNSSGARMPRNFVAKLREKLNFLFLKHRRVEVKTRLARWKFMFLNFPLVARFQNKKHKLGG